MPIGVSSAPYAKFPNPGDRHGGEIVDFRVVQTTDPKTRRPQYLQQNDDGSWERTFDAYRRSDGKPNDPITQWEITVDTGVEDENGDSELRIFVDPRKGRRGTTTEGRRGGDAVAKALKKARAHRHGLEIGGGFYFVFDGKVNEGDNRVNTWSAEYEPPAGGPGSGKALDERPWLIGGTRFDKAAEMAKWEAGQMPALREALSRPAAAPQEAPAQGDQRPLWPSNHASSPVLNRPAASAPAAVASPEDDEPPF